MVVPAALSATSAVASTRKETTTPAADATKPARKVRGVAGSWPTNPKSLSDRTGNTQGIKFRMSPPTQAVIRMVHQAPESPVVAGPPDWPPAAIDDGDKPRDSIPASTER